jgi:hypothetical protein
VVLHFGRFLKHTPTSDSAAEATTLLKTDAILRMDRSNKLSKDNRGWPFSMVILVVYIHDQPSIIGSISLYLKQRHARSSAHARLRALFLKGGYLLLPLSW